MQIFAHGCSIRVGRFSSPPMKVGSNFKGHARVSISSPCIKYKGNSYEKLIFGVERHVSS